MLRYIYFIDKASRKKLTVPEIPFSRIDEIGAGLYKGQHITQEERNRHGKEWLAGKENEQKEGKQKSQG